MLKKATADLARLRTIARVMARHGFGEWIERTRLGALVGGRRGLPKLAPEEQRVSTARRFRNLLVELGPTFVKVGQILSARPDILPTTFTDELAGLQDAVPPISAAEMRAQIAAALGAPAEEFFASIDDTPLASASIAQVHRAVLKTGERVVIKVQRPGIAPTIRADLDLLIYLAKILERSVAEVGIYSASEVAREFERALLSELDFTNEANNLRAFARAAAKREFIVLPKVHDALTRKTILTMEELIGIKITDVPKDSPDYDRALLASRLVEEGFTEVFEDGLFHGDPHPGNILVLPGNKLGLLDLGLVGRLSKSMQETIIVLVMAIALRDADTLARLIYKVGVPDERINLSRFRSDIHEVLDRYLGLQLAEVDSPMLLRDLLDLAMRYRIRVPKEFALLSKSSITLEGILRRIAPEMDVAAAALPHSKRLMLERYNPRSLSGGFFKMLLTLQGLVQDVPTQVAQILMDLEGGKFSVRMIAPELASIDRHIKALGVIIFMGLIASGLIIGSFTLLAHYPWEWRGLPVLALLGLASAAWLFGAAVTWYLFSGRLKKIHVRRWLKK